LFSLFAFLTSHLVLMVTKSVSLLSTCLAWLGMLDTLIGKPTHLHIMTS
jgi:hypothetical protein